MNTRLCPKWVGTLMRAFLFGSSIASAAPPIININPSTEVPKPYDGFNEVHGNGMVGWTFQLLQPFTVTQVGWYNEGGDGLSRAFQIGLWQGEGSDANPGTPQFPGAHYSSLIGDPDAGLAIPSGTNASLVGDWRVVDLAAPLTLQPGFYQLGGVDSSQTTDVIKYVVGKPPGYCPLTPPGSPLVLGQFFYAVPSLPAGQVSLHPTTNYYLHWGMELGPMLFGTNSPQSNPTLGLNIRPFQLMPPGPGLPGTGVLLTWPSGALEQADEIVGPYAAITNAASPYIVPTSSSSSQKFYRLKP